MFPKNNKLHSNSKLKSPNQLFQPNLNYLKYIYTYTIQKTTKNIYKLHTQN